MLARDIPAKFKIKLPRLQPAVKAGLIILAFAGMMSFEKTGSNPDDWKFMPEKIPNLFKNYFSKSQSKMSLPK